MKITLTLKSSYGRTLAYPADATAETFARMLGVKTLTRSAINHIKSLGFEVETQAGASLEDVQ